MLCALIALVREARAEDGGNDVCPAISVDADDVREQYDDEGRLVHQLRLSRGQYAQEVGIAWRDEHAVARTELTPGHRRIARTTWRDDKVRLAECYLDDRPIGRAIYRYDADERLIFLRKWSLDADTWRAETTRFQYDADGRLTSTEVRGADGRLLRRVLSERAPLAIPVRLAFSAGGAYQSDTELYDINLGLGIHRRPSVQRYGSDPLDVGLEANFKFHRAAGLTSTDQTTVRFSADYHDILPRITLFTFTSTDRDLPANLRLNLEEAVLGVKFDVVPRGHYQLDVSFAPIWNFRAIRSPTADGEVVEENTSKLRGSLRARAGVHFEHWSLLDTFEWLPTLTGDDVAQEDDFWNRSVARNTVTLEVALAPRLSFREEFKYVRDFAMRAQATCPDSANPLCRGYSFASTTSLVLNLDL